MPHKPLIHLLRRLGLENLLRDSYYRLLGPFLRKELTLNSLRIAFCVPTAEQADSFMTYGGERDVLEQFLERLPLDAIVWDIGANLGLWTLFCSVKTRNRGQVVAFEPDTAARRYLERNVRINHMDNVHIVPCALGSETGSVPFFVGTRDSQVSGLTPQKGNYPTAETAVTVQMMRGADVVAQNIARAPFAAKIDVEGAEMAVLQGFDDDVWAKLRLLFVEVHPELLARQSGSVEKIRFLLTARGFKVIFESARRTELHWLCWRS